MATVLEDIKNVDKIAVTIPNAALLCDVSINTVRAAITHGDLEKHSPTSTPIIYVLDLHEWVKNLPAAPPKKTKK